MKVWLNRDGFYVWLREPKNEERAGGFVVKLRSRLSASERFFGPWKHATTIGPFYFRTYARRG